MTTRTPPCLLLLLLLPAAGCASTNVVETWRDPAQTGPLDFGRTLVIVRAPDTYARNVAEDTLVERIGPDRSVAGHSVLADEDRWGSAKLKYELSKGNYDGVVTMAIVGTRTISGGDGDPDTGEPFYAYYDRSGAFTMADEGPASTETIYRVGTRVYAVKGERLVWSALSDTVDPKDARSAVQGIAKAVGGDLRKQKLIH